MVKSVSPTNKFTPKPGFSLDYDRCWASVFGTFRSRQCARKAVISGRTRTWAHEYMPMMVCRQHANGYNFEAGEYEAPGHFIPSPVERA